ncbi:hypothetical protein ACUXCC_004755 [Cytobacillus horneckiae]|uniref:hypothetical protein n=1 Tax=Cytobacillus horneckiae TaxID=549687 RepID=UPI000A51BE0E|nr:hypothetical protein [Cytobacillus horneckiae]NRG44486.1 hypothetical protein [Bacillus sp. CRN 9]MBN6889500.1 hypothetical protein [Cytobacillus horneckiae]MCM3176815.1 hypothetical protein [Cytobacillus horneckiae]MEC1156657.1 hypothetical protein [Cytobacillus horneckiae]MED2939122.1 hypothetical protein [Cytobacillus horneckiae]
MALIRKKRKRNEQKGDVWNAFWDVVFYIPEIIILPFRLVFFIFRKIIRILEWN